VLSERILDAGGDTFQPRDVPAVKDTVDSGLGTDVGGDCEQVKVW